MHRFALAFGLLASVTTAATTETITFAAEDGFRFIRCTDFLGAARCEYVASESSGLHTCVAFDKQDQPIASTVALIEMGPVTFPDIDHKTIHRMICRR